MSEYTVAVAQSQPFKILLYGIDFDGPGNFSEPQAELTYRGLDADAVRPVLRFERSHCEHLLVWQYILMLAYPKDESDSAAADAAAGSPALARSRSTPSPTTQPPTRSSWRRWDNSADVLSFPTTALMANNKPPVLMPVPLCPPLVGTQASGETNMVHMLGANGSVLASYEPAWDYPRFTGAYFSAARDSLYLLTGAERAVGGSR